MLPSALPPLCIPLSSVKQGISKMSKFLFYFWSCFKNSFLYKIGGGLVACLQLVVRAVYPLLYYDRQSKKMLTEADEK